MNDTDLAVFKQWFSAYTQSFLSEEDEDRRNILLKVVHTERVCGDIIKIASGISFAEDLMPVAEAVALFHDVGRFPQYAEYKTFNDSLSVNHGSLGAQVLREEGVLSSLNAYEQSLILHCVSCHNCLGIPAIEDDKTLLSLKLIRDADKLDIWRVFTEYYGAHPEERASAVSLGLPDLPTYSEEVMACVREGRIARLTQVKTLNDFKLMQLSWVYDLNFLPTIALLTERGYVDRIASTLRQTAEVVNSIHSLKEHLAHSLAVNPY